MSLSAYTGLMRSGKSYGVVENVILPALKQGRTVVHNMILHEDAIRRITTEGTLIKLPEDFKADQLVDLCPAGAYAVIDEAWKYFPAGVTIGDVPQAVVSFITEHGHRVGADGYSQELAFMVQNTDMLSKWARELIDFQYISNKLEAVGQATRYRIDIHKLESGKKATASNKVREIFGKYEPEIYACYKSHTMSVSGLAGKEVKSDDRGNILKSWRFKATVAAALLLPFLIYKAAHSFQDLGESSTKKAQSVQQHLAQQTLPVAQQPVQSLPLPTTPPKPKGPQYSTMWRLLGVIVHSEGQAKGSGKAILTSAVGRRQIDTQGNCTEDTANNWTCKLDGELVTMWSGTSYSTSYSAQVPEGVLTTH